MSAGLLSGPEGRCRACGQQRLQAGLDLGPQPIANRFKATAAEPDYRRSLKITQCEACGLVQLAESFPSDELRPRLEWVRYREREDHLAEAVASFIPALSSESQALVFGLTDFDRVLFQALEKQLPGSSYVQLSAHDLDISVSQYGMETIQRALTPACARGFVQQRGRARIMVTRYLFEHAENTLHILSAYSELLADDGFLIVEVPDSEGPLERCDYPMIWEEHNSYFTESTLRFVLENNGFAVRAVFKAASKFESPLMMLAQKQSRREVPVQGLPAELARLEKFAARFAPSRQGFEVFCRQRTEAGFKVVLFGAGHFSVAFANFFSLEKNLACVIDDDANKAGKFLAGTSLPIVSSDQLSEYERVSVLLCVNPDVEERVVEKLGRFRRDGFELCSIFSGSPRFCLHE